MFLMFNVFFFFLHFQVGEKKRIMSEKKMFSMIKQTKNLT